MSRRVRRLALCKQQYVGEYDAKAIVSEITLAQLIIERAVADVARDV